MKSVRKLCKVIRHNNRLHWQFTCKLCKSLVTINSCWWVKLLISERKLNGLYRQINSLILRNKKITSTGEFTRNLRKLYAAVNSRNLYIKAYPYFWFLTIITINNIDKLYLNFIKIRNTIIKLWYWSLFRVVWLSKPEYCSYIILLLKRQVYY